MNLHTDTKLFRQAIQYVSDTLGIPAIYVEKDYWVTYALRKIVNAPIGKEVIFKGGTALSKCFKLIERFSEDIDFVVLRNDKESGNRLKEKLREISNSIIDDLPEVDIEGITKKNGNESKNCTFLYKSF